ncbi:response regulator transcription factor [Ruminiclostridium papyrosolvens]|uniref:Stage 0 sporulation protein A homolog n=1 Tax=Ruminiclostridium papyrosolvens C7 TaxID=1330534 RepID=U4QZT7_9FIRM|nr:helix-turn-helix domain-containing protein [Ruminiclostridium papyrosolvens]EPR10499.1 hypothetical protein L323_12930 [Ruminiclostridium papyrosolvens C7]
MKRVMIVDDEYIVRIGVKSMIDWEKWGYSVVCDAINGQDAIEKISQYSPQIILTDLMMEPVNGLELIEYCSKNALDIKIIVLSNYTDFEKVKMAMKLGARDFIFKLTINADELLAILDNVSKEINERKMSGKDAEMLLRNNAGVIRERLINIMIERSYLNKADLMKELCLVNVKCDFNKTYAVLFLSVADYNIVHSSGETLEPDLFSASLENIVGEVMDEIIISQTFRYEKNQCIVTINLPRRRLDREFIGKVQAGFLRIVKSVELYFGMQIYGVMSKETVGLENLSNAVADCRRVMNERFFMKENKLLLCTDEKPKQQGFHMPSDFRLSDWREALEDFNFSEADTLLRRTISYFYEKEGIEPYHVREALYELYRVIKADGLTKGIMVDKLTDDNGMTLYQAIFEYDLLIKIEESFLSVLGLYVKESSKIGNKKLKKEIAKIVAYVKENLSSELSVATAARVIHISESHFSHLFKSEMGVSFVDYVNRLRIEKAMKLLIETDKNINEISYEVGINSPNYFSILFKKITKMPPNEYRNSKITE